ncbi:MAG TPA: oxidoreductase, partial [Pyrinomonadaceae bacterium]
GRRPLPVEHEKLEQHTIDFARLAEFAPLLQTQDIFSCLGTTIKKAGTRDAFREVDYTYQYEAARMAAQAGAEQLLLVSSMGANARSSIFYNRVKGELEDAVSKLPLRGVQIFRPSLLLGAREEFRRGERVSEYAMKTFSFLLLGPLEKYRPVQASAVAHAMLKIAKEHPSGVNVFESNRISAMGDGA